MHIYLYQPWIAVCFLYYDKLVTIYTFWAEILVLITVAHMIVIFDFISEYDFGCL